MTAKSTAIRSSWVVLAGAPALAALMASPAVAQNLPVTPTQKATAEQVAQTGVPLSELSPTAPDNYTVKSGDTLWAISGMFLKSPWRWPELWGMNMEEIRNPHRIYPGQQLYLDKANGRATLRSRQAASGIPTDTVRVSPRTRYESLADLSLPTLKPNLIEPFLSEPVIVDEKTLQMAPRIVATQEGHVMLSKGDRAYALGDPATPLSVAEGKPRAWRVFRNAVALRDPETQEILGYEAQYIGKADLVRGESETEVVEKDKKRMEKVPATIDILSGKEEIRSGDRLLPEPGRSLVSYTPRAPERPITGSIVSVYGSSVQFAAQNQVVVINRGTRDGLESGHVLAILKKGELVTDRTGADGKKITLQLPNERNGLLMVFRPFERLSYALILDITDGVKAGDRLANPR